MADSTLKTYRHSVTGLVGRYHPRVALAHPHLEEVADGTKNLLMPIPKEAIEQYRAQNSTPSDEDEADSLDDTEEEN